MNRRDVLQGAIVLAAGAVAGCDRLTKIAHETEPAKALGSKLVLKGQDNYETLRQAGVWNAKKPDRFPAAIVLAENAQDVIQAVRLAKAKGWKVGTRSGGHSWEGTHTRDGALLINLAKMRAVKISPEQRLATVSPSLKGDELAKLLEKHALMFPSAHGYGIGLGGFVLHGGHGWNSLRYGLGCENLVAIDVVTPQGELIHADETHNSDYLWAARGSGPGFFGVVTQLYLRLHPKPRMQRFARYSFREPEWEPLLRWFGDKMHSFPAFAEISPMGRRTGDKFRIDLNVLGHADNPAEQQQIEQLIATCPVIGKAFGVVPMVPASFPTTADSPEQPTGARYVVDGSWTNAGAEEIIPPFLKAVKGIPTDLSMVFWMSFLPERKLPDMAYSVRGASYLSPTGTSFDAKDDKRLEDWAEGFIRDVLPMSVGGQFNDDATLLNQKHGIHQPYLSKASASRMQSLLAKYDPDKMFGYIAPV